MPRTKRPKPHYKMTLAELREMDCFLLRDMETQGGNHFDGGQKMEVISKRGTLWLLDENGKGIRGVSFADVQFRAKEEPNKS